MVFKHGLIGSQKLYPPLLYIEYEVQLKSPQQLRNWLKEKTKDKIQPSTVIVI